MLKLEAVVCFAQIGERDRVTAGHRHRAQLMMLPVPVLVRDVFGLGRLSSQVHDSGVIGPHVSKEDLCFEYRYILQGEIWIA